MHWQRQYLHPMLAAFDAPTREECTARRTASNTPQAALVLLNDPSFLETARALAVRVLREPVRRRDDRPGVSFPRPVPAPRSGRRGRIRRLDRPRPTGSEPGRGSGPRV